MSSPVKRDVPRLSFSLTEFCEATGMTRTAAYEAVADGSLRTFKHGRRRFVSAQAAQEWVRAHEQGGQGGGQRAKSRT